MNRNLLLDIHTHTLVSGHAYGTIREMAFAAKEKGIELLGISEHAPGIPGTCDPFYYLNLGVVPRKIYGVEIIHGCEINVLNDGQRCVGDFSEADKLLNEVRFDNELILNTSIDKFKKFIHY